MLGPDMTGRVKIRLAALALGALSLLSSAGAAPGQGDSKEAKAKLAAVRSKIADLTSRLGKDLKERDSLSARLREAELAITGKRRRLEDLKVEQAAVEKRRTELKVEQAKNREAIAAERESLSSDVRAAYIIGRQEEIKLLLNQNNPAALGRTLSYYGYFAGQRTATIERIQAEEEKLSALAADVEVQNDKLKSLAADTSREMAALQSARNDRADSVAAISKRLANGNDELAKLKREEAAVETLIAELARAMQDFPTDSSKPFADMRGKLPWPVPGKLAAQYQTARPDSSGSVRWNGIMIRAAKGTKVRAPYFGRVVYADWLQGLGLLLIIGHSGGYMTLYGHAEVLYKSVGDTVSPGDVIAALPDNGADPELYFEIRSGRKTVDPKAWLRTQQ